MPPLPVIAVFDVGKTNKKLLLFNEQYDVVYEQAARFAETVDEDGFPCEDLESLRASLHHSLHMVFQKSSFRVKALNVTAYGASFVYIDSAGEPLSPLYNYLKPYPGALQQALYAAYGGPERFAVATASPLLGSLNSGLQLYRIKKEQPALFDKITYALHLPQYLAYLVTGAACSDSTSIGCHTALWDFEKVRYHDWVAKEGLLQKLAPLCAADKTKNVTLFGNECAVGIGLHDSSAALIPYQLQFPEPFLLISTGTWSIALNPFNNAPLTAAELAQDCLCYLDYKGNPVKAARTFLGPQFEDGLKRIGAHFQKDGIHYRNLEFDVAVLAAVKEKYRPGSFAQQDISLFANDIEAYYALVLDLVQQQGRSALLVLQKNTKRIFVDGGFSKNAVFMNLLAAHFTGRQVYATSMAQGTALGAALAIHAAWNNNAMPANSIGLIRYACIADTLL